MRACQDIPSNSCSLVSNVISSVSIRFLHLFKGNSKDQMGWTMKARNEMNYAPVRYSYKVLVSCHSVSSRFLHLLRIKDKQKGQRGKDIEDTCGKQAWFVLGDISSTHGKISINRPI